MRDFCPVVLALTGAMDHGGEDLSMCSRITPKLIGDQLPGYLSLMFQSPTEEALSRSANSTLGDQNIDHVSILIDGPPMIEALALDGDEEFIDVPDVAEPSLFSPQSSSIGRTELLTPISDRLVRHNDAPLSEQVFDVAKAQGEPMVQPNGVADDSRRKTVASIN